MGGNVCNYYGDPVHAKQIWSNRSGAVTCRRKIQAMKIASVLDLLSRKRGRLFPVWHSFNPNGSVETMSCMREL